MPGMATKFSIGGSLINFLHVEVSGRQIYNTTSSENIKDASLWRSDDIGSLVRYNEVGDRSLKVLVDLVVVRRVLKPLEYGVWVGKRRIKQRGSVKTVLYPNQMLRRCLPRVDHGARRRAQGVDLHRTRLDPPTKHLGGGVARHCSVVSDCGLYD